MIKRALMITAAASLLMGFNSVPVDLNNSDTLVSSLTTAMTPMSQAQRWDYAYSLFVIAQDEKPGDMTVDGLRRAARLAAALAERGRMDNADQGVIGTVDFFGNATMDLSRLDGQAGFAQFAAANHARLNGKTSQQIIDEAKQIARKAYAYDSQKYAKILGTLNQDISQISARASSEAGQANNTRAEGQAANDAATDKAARFVKALSVKDLTVKRTSTGMNARGKFKIKVNNIMGKPIKRANFIMVVSPWDLPDVRMIFESSYNAALTRNDIVKVGGSETDTVPGRAHKITRDIPDGYTPSQNPSDYYIQSFGIRALYEDGTRENLISRYDMIAIGTRAFERDNKHDKIASGCKAYLVRLQKSLSDVTAYKAAIDANAALKDLPRVPHIASDYGCQ